MCSFGKGRAVVRPMLAGFTLAATRFDPALVGRSAKAESRRTRAIEQWRSSEVEAHGFRLGKPRPCTLLPQHLMPFEPPERAEL
jgi:hypothetical protein